jgi:UDP-N-acetyl-D-glucosamine dehydrogenase
VKKVSVIGQGYVGLPLALAAAQSGYHVTGIDVSQAKIKALTNGISFIEDISSTTLQELLASGNYIPTCTFESIANSKVIVICVPTPLDENKEPDLSHIENALCEILKYLQPDTLIILESTVAPGTTRNFLANYITSNSKISIDQFFVAFSPERIDPGNKEWEVQNTPKIIAGINLNSLDKACQFYSKFISNLYRCESLEIAETAKLLENSFRLVNISLVSELSRFCTTIGVDVNKVIDAAATKPYGFMRFTPSVGVGGHCIPVDPIYLSNAASKSGAPIKLIDLAFQINQDLPQYFLLRAERVLKNLSGKRILIIGVAYKPNVSDVRETAVKPLIDLLKEKNVNVTWHDDLVKTWNGEVSTQISSDFDLAILATPHDYLDLSALKNVPILDTRESV